MPPIPPRPKKPNTDFRAVTPRRALGVSTVNGAFFALLLCILLGEIGVLDLLPLLRNRPEIALLFVVFGLGIGAVRREKWLHLATGIAAILWLGVAFSPLSARLVRPLMAQTTPGEIARGADAVVVLASSLQHDGEFTGDSLPRLIRGLELVRGGHAPCLVLTEVRPPSGSYSAAAKALTAKLKTPVNLITLKGPMGDTHDEAVAVAKLAKQRGWKRIYLVTSPTHTRRASLVFRRAARETKLVVLPVASQEINTDLQTLDTPADRLRAFSTAIHEIIGMQIYRRRGWI